MSSYVKNFCYTIIIESEADTYDEAIQEWEYNGDRWKEAILTRCICGHPLMERCMVLV